MPSPSQDIAELPHDNVQPNLISCAVITWVIAAVFVGLRFYARRIVINAWGISDWLILASLVRLPSQIISTLAVLDETRFDE